MDPVDAAGRHEAKRPRLDRPPSNGQGPCVRRDEQPAPSIPATYNHGYPVFTGYFNGPPQPSAGYPSVPYPYGAGFGFQSSFTTPFNYHSQPINFVNQSSGPPLPDSQFVANEYSYGPANVVPWAHPMPVQVPMFMQVPMPVPVPVPIQGPRPVQVPAQSHTIWHNNSAVQLNSPNPIIFVSKSGQSYSVGPVQAPINGTQSPGSVQMDTSRTLTELPDEIVLQQSNEDENKKVCFGMISGVSARCEKPGLEKSTPVYSVCLGSSSQFIATSDPQMKGTIPAEHRQMIQGLLGESALELYTSCTLLIDPSSSKASKGPSAQLSCVLDITVYGPWELFEKIGIWFQEYGVYLQDPRECHIDVKYCNPHRLSSGDYESCLLLSQVVSHTGRPSYLLDVKEGPELLEILSSNVELEETPQPKAIRASLQSHQKKALTFLLRREKGWAFDTNQSDIWERVDTEQGRYFVNRVSEAHQVEEPQQFYGGIIADPMGLGKTLTMIALVATDLDESIAGDSRLEIDDEEFVSTTLIIVPPPLLGTWEEQLAEHVVEGSIKWYCHHGKTRFADRSELGSVNVVLTTYHTVSAEWKTGNSILFSIRWRRIVLDEAHYIRNGNSRMAQAVCALSSVSRWAVTGTPIQNRLGDIATLLRFIRAHPYTDPKTFDADISRLWKSGRDEEAVRRLKLLSASLLLRRPKATINLAQRKDTQCPVDFDREERALYDEMREQAVNRIEEVLQNDSQASRASGYVNVLQQIEALRLVCDLGLHYHSRHQNLQHLVVEATDWANIAQETFNVQRGMGPIVCVQCSSTLELTEALFDDSTTTQTNAVFSRCLRLVCSECISNPARANRLAVCLHKPPCPTAPVSTSASVIEDASGCIPAQIKPLSAGLPSKVKALVADIKSLPPNVKCIVFSTWRLTLDIVKGGLDQASIQSLRFDGKVPQKDRQSVIEKFKTDPTIRVMLLTLSCGAVGLTLTVASRAYLMEPHWNPTLEEQALARIHRIGQTQEVTTVRFYMRDSFEEQVMELQESKKNLAGVLLSPHDGGIMDDSLGTLQRLRLLL